MATDFIPEELNRLIERTLADAKDYDGDVFVPLADYLQENGHPLGERLVNPNVDPHSKLAEIIKLSCGLTLDLNPADNGTKRSQEQWFNEYWNTVNDGRVMASMGDLYRNFKVLKKASEQGTVDQKNLAQTLLASLRDDFDWSEKKNWLVSSTRVNYAGNKSLDAEIIHHYNRPDLAKRTALAIPVYQDDLLAEVVYDHDGLRYVRALLDTDDGAEEIIKTLNFVSDRSDIRTWTAATDRDYHRDSYSSRAAGFSEYYIQFDVIGSSIEDLGRSRGVWLTP